MKKFMVAIVVLLAVQTVMSGYGLYVVMEQLDIIRMEVSSVEYYTRGMDTKMERRY